MMARLYILSLLGLALSALQLVYAQDADRLETALTSAGIDAEFPDEPGYANASLPLNLRYAGIRPFAIAYPAGAEQVSTSLKAAGREGLKVAARSGGHSYIAGGLGTTDGHFVVDLSKNTQLSYDNVTEIATIGPGNRLGDVALFLNEYGRAIPHGRCPFVGIGGHSGHGGWGHHSRHVVPVLTAPSTNRLKRLFGLVVDVVVEATVVTADGTVLTVSENENQDLFWAIRGASSSFGVVIEIKVKTFPQPPEASIYHYTWTSIPAANASAHLAAFQDFTLNDVSSTFGGSLLYYKGAVEGEVQVELFGGYWGSHDTFNSTLEPYLGQFPEPDHITLTQGTYFEGLENWVYSPLNTTNSTDSPLTYYAKSVLTPEGDPLNEESIDRFVNYLSHEGFTTQAGWGIEVEVYGGNGSAINTRAESATAFPHRNTLFAFQLAAYTTFSFTDDAFMFVDGLADSITEPEPEDWEWSAYLGYPDTRLEDWQKRYFKGNYPRLQHLKAQYDPANTFEFPLSVEPPST